MRESERESKQASGSLTFPPAGSFSGGLDVRVTLRLHSFPPSSLPSVRELDSKSTTSLLSRSFLLNVLYPVSIQGMDDSNATLMSTASDGVVFGNETDDGRWSPEKYFITPHPDPSLAACTGMVLRSDLEVRKSTRLDVSPFQGGP